MTPGAALEEVEWLVRSGVNIRCGVQVGRDLSLAELEARHDAIFIGAGLSGVPALGLPGEDLPGVFDALDLIACLKLGKDPGVPIAGARVAVLGGGNTAIDVATQTARAGASEVWLVYRRGFGDMSAYPHEVHLATEHGARMIFHTVPQRILGQGRVQGLEVSEVRMEKAAEARGGPRFVPVPGTTRLLPVDVVVRATGQKGAGLLSLLSGLQPPVKIDGGVVVVNEEGQTQNPRYWAGGDCISGGQEVVNAVAEGKRAARGIAREVLSRLSPSAEPGPETKVN
jgi:glutamate synthase (NADPH/NADH) small chain